MKIINSIRQQVLLLFVGYAVGLGCLYLALTMVTAYIVEDQMIYSLLNIEAEYLENQHRDTGAIPKPRLSFASLYHSLGGDRDSELAQYVSDKTSELVLEVASGDNEIFTEGDKHFHFTKLAVSTEKPVYMLAEVSSLLVVSKHPMLLQLFLAGFILTLFVAFILAYRMATYTVKPVLQLATAIDQKKPLPTLKFELNDLSSTLQRAFDEKAEALSRERDFSSDLSHELRTPLTVLRNTLTLAERRGLNDEDIVQLKHIDQQMQHTVDILLALARQENLVLEPCYVVPILEQAVMDCSLAAGREFSLMIDLDEQLKMLANPQLLALLFSNLLNNALYHGGNAPLKISGDSQHLLFQNDSDKPLPVDAENVGVKRSDSPGIGQGLYLVSRILEAMSMSYQIEQGDGLFSVKISL